MCYCKPDSKLFSNKITRNPTKITSDQKVFLIFKRYILNKPDRVINEIRKWYLRRLAEKNMDRIITGISQIRRIVFFRISIVFSDNLPRTANSPKIRSTATMPLRIRKAGSRKGAGSKEIRKKCLYSIALIIHLSNQK